MFTEDDFHKIYPNLKGWIINKQSSFGYFNIQEAEDFASKTCLDVYEKTKDGRQIKNLGGFCFKVLRDFYYDHIRRQSKFREILSKMTKDGSEFDYSLNEENKIIPISKGHEDKVLAKITYEECIKKLKSETPKSYEYYIKKKLTVDPETGNIGVSSETLAKITGIPSGTLKQYLVAAKRNLGLCLEENLRA